MSDGPARDELRDIPCRSACHWDRENGGNAMGIKWGQATRARMQGVQLILVGLALVGAGVIVTRAESSANAVVDVTPSAGTDVYSDTAQSDAEAEGLDVPPCDPGYHVGESNLCWPGPVVTAPDGTTTVNDVHPDGTVTGTVTTPNGDTRIFPMPGETACEPGYTRAEDMSCVPPGFYDDSPIQEDDPRWDCRSMGNRKCGVTMGGADYVITFDDAGDPIRIEYADAPEWGHYDVNPPVFD